MNTKLRNTMTTSQVRYPQTAALIFLLTASFQFPMTSSQSADTATSSDTSDSTDNTIRLEILVGSSNYSTDREFLSVMLGSSVFKRSAKFNCDLTNKRMLNIGTSLAPCILRLGGTASHHLLFDPDGTRSADSIPDGDFTMTGAEFETVTNYSRDVGWDIVWDFNLFHWEDVNRTVWNSSFAKEILDYSEARGIRIKYFQLGNEVSAYSFKFGFKVTGEQLTNHFNKLRDVLAEYPDYKDSKIVGPDLGNIYKSTHRNYLIEFMDAGGNNSIDILGQHQYYLDGNIATVEDFLKPEVMDLLKATLDFADDVVFSRDPDLPFWFSETSSCFGGGAPDISNRYVAGFLWLDKLGVSAQRGVHRVMRQTYCGVSSYALISSDLQPYPDLWLSVLFKHLVEGPVFTVSFEPNIAALRVYAQCARQDVYGYPPGAVVVYYLNTQNASLTLTLKNYEDLDLELFQLTATNQSMTSLFVDLNGETIVMEGDNLPPLNPKVHSGDVTLQGQSFGFIVIPKAQVPLCGYIPPTPTTTTTTTTTTNTTTSDNATTTTTPVITTWTTDYTIDAAPPMLHCSLYFQKIVSWAFAVLLIQLFVCRR